jgi:hypothetical protein
MFLHLGRSICGADPHFLISRFPEIYERFKTINEA